MVLVAATNGMYQVMTIRGLRHGLHGGRGGKADEGQRTGRGTRGRHHTRRGASQADAPDGSRRRTI